MLLYHQSAISSLPAYYMHMHIDMRSTVNRPNLDMKTWQTRTCLKVYPEQLKSMVATMINMQIMKWLPSRCGDVILLYPLCDKQNAR